MRLSGRTGHGPEYSGSVCAEQLPGGIERTRDRCRIWRTVGSLASYRSFINDRPKKVPDSGQFGLEECQNVTLSGDNSGIEGGFILDEERFKVGFIQPSRTLSLGKG